MDRLRFDVVAVEDDSGGGFAVEVFVNEVEMTAAGAGLGMDPYDVLVPENRFVATAAPRRIPVARCDCGNYGCGMTDVTISLDHDVVRWKWHQEVPIQRAVEFDAAAYAEEVGRLERDRSWETPERVAGRLVLSDADTVAALAEHGLRFSWVATAYDDTERFRVSLGYGNTHQIFVDVPWEDRTPEQLAAAVADTLRRAPARWPASWHAISADGPPPDIAGPGWTRYRFRE